MKKSKMLLAVLLCLAMLMSTTALALGETDRVLLPLSIVTFFEEQGYDISRTATMDVVALQPDGTSLSRSAAAETDFALRLTERDGFAVTETLFLFYGERDDGTYGIDSEAAFTLANAPRTRGQSITLNSDVMISPTYSYTTYTASGVGTLHRPTSLSWSYSKLDSSASVTYILVEYWTGGALYTYPGISYVTAPYSHKIGASASNPVAGSIYSNYSNPLSSDRMIAVGSAGGGITMDFTATINGTRYSDSYLTWS